MLNRIDKIFICHYTKLVDRKPILQKQLLDYNLEAEFIKILDKEDIDMNKLLIDFPNINKNLSIQGHTHRTLRMSEISLILKHNHIWKKMVDENINNVLVLEDDALFSEDFVNRFNNYITELPQDYDLLWVGSCCDIKMSGKIENKFVYEHIGSRCTHAYMISKNCVEKILEYSKTNNSPCDYMFNEAIIKYSLKNYWLEPHLISQNNLFNTVIQNDRNFI